MVCFKNIMLSKVCESIPCIINGDSVAHTNCEKAGLLNDFFVQQTVLPDTTVHKHLPEFRRRTKATLDSITTPNEVYKVLIELNINKGSGLDLISNKVRVNYSVNIPGKARFSGATAKSVFNSKIEETVP